MSQQVTFRLTYADLSHLDRHGRLGLSILTWLGAVAITTGLTLSIWKDHREFFDRETGLPPEGQVALLLPVVFAIFFFAARHFLRRAQKPLLEHEHTIDIAPETFTMASRSGTHQLPWSRIRAVSTDTHGIYVTTVDGDRLIIPSRAFGSRDAQDEFLATTRRLIDQIAVSDPASR